MTTAPARSVSETELNILAALQEHGSRMTFPRRELAAVLARWAGSFSAEEVVAKMPDLGRATIYRTLRLLVDVGILCKTALWNGSPRYSLDEVHHHHHLVCISCGQIEEFRHPYVERMLRAMVSQIHDVIEHRLELYHRCASCRESSSQNPYGRTHGTNSHAH